MHIANKKFPSLEEAQNRDISDGEVVERFLKLNKKIDKSFAKEILFATKTHIWLSKKLYMEYGDYLTYIDKTYIIDQMWHNMILFTGHYHDYCNSLYGEYVHHIPCVSEEDQKTTVDEIMIMLERISKYVPEKLIRKWYIEWPQELHLSYSQSV